MHAGPDAMVCVKNVNKTDVGVFQNSLVKNGHNIDGFSELN